MIISRMRSKISLKEPMASRKGRNMGIKRPKRVYISGKITGLSEKEWTENFEAAEKALTDAGYRVINPAKVKVDLDYQEYLTIDIILLGRCDAIYLLDNWQDSNGAKVERATAEALNLTVIDISNREIYLKKVCEKE